MPGYPITSDISLPSSIQIDTATFTGALVASTLRVTGSFTVSSGLTIQARAASLGSAIIQSQTVMITLNGTAAELVFQWKATNAAFYQFTVTGSQS